MELENYALIAEIFAAAAVVLSLIYVGYQVHQNTHAMRLGAISASIPSIHDWYLAIAQDEDLAELMLRAQTDIDALSPVETHRAENYIDTVFSIGETAYAAFRGTDLGAWVDHMAIWWRDRLKYEIYRRRWSATRGWYDVGYQQLIDSVIAEVKGEA